MENNGHSSRLSSTLSGLSLETSKNNTKPTQKKPKEVVADSWEDDDTSGEDTPEPTPTSKLPNPPPPTPASPLASSSQGWNDASYPVSSPSPRGESMTDSDRRPEKTDAVARRMIAAGLGLKAPKQTDEQKAYQKSIREQEKRKRDQEKLDEQKRKETAEKAKAAVWDD